jgi:hypothetical protein
LNDAEAATVKKIYELYAGGHGLPTIAHMLNAAGAPCPRAQQSRVSGWCPASVREILKRPLYRGEIIWGKAKKRDDDWQVRAVKRPEGGDVDTLQRELRECEKAIRRLTSAIASGGDLPTLVTALETQERQRKELTTRLEMARTPKPELDSATVRAQLESYLTDWQGLLRGHVYQAQQILRRLIKGRLTMTPQQPSGFARPYYAFAGCGTVRPLLGGIVRLLASPTFASWNQIGAWLNRLDALRRAA